MPLPPYEGARLLAWVFSHGAAEDCGLSTTETSSTNTCCAALGFAIKRSACDYANQTVTPTGDEVCVPVVGEYTGRDTSTCAMHMC